MTIFIYLSTDTDGGSFRRGEESWMVYAIAPDKLGTSVMDHLEQFAHTLLLVERLVLSYNWAGSRSKSFVI